MCIVHAETRAYSLYGGVNVILFIFMPCITQNGNSDPLKNLFQNSPDAMGPLKAGILVSDRPLFLD
jgi:hypothetical protein